ncbi:hypothetical protein K488DRAFT_58459 [Vararia minispora EC-137]|uniref:Uncharacterized protein n=1 Tax=Vararia minispora EC-137 TaxID=1314806 RepID=A0ACB8QAB4_9AGAM|nr:hypothetical protein K488DRAFT_58459 [Vararia minispora EC-137]
MGQYWMILNLDKKEKMFLGKLGETFFEVHSDLQDTLKAFALPEMPKLGAKKIQYSLALLTNDRDCGRRGLLALPAEILAEITGSLDSIYDLICLAAACHHLWEACRVLIQKQLKGTTWAGCRIICLGDESDDLPPTVALSEVEQAEVLEWGNTTSEPVDYAPALLWSYAAELYEYRDDDVNLKRGLRMLILDGPPAVAIENMTDRPWHRSDVLRNLSKRLYVRQAVLNKLWEELTLRHPQLKQEWNMAPCVGNALLCRICWSTSDNAAMNVKEESITQGPWAGDRFDVVHMRELKMDSEFPQWQDVSEEVFAVLRKCWESELRCNAE